MWKLISLLVFLSFSFLNSYSQELWNTVYNRGESSIKNAAFLSHSLILISGWQSFGGCGSGFLSAYDLNGISKWKKNGAYDEFHINEFYVLAAGLNIGADDVSGDEYLVLTKLDFDGNIIFSESFKANDNARVADINEFSNGDILFINDLSIFITDQAGNLKSEIQSELGEFTNQVEIIGDTNLLISTQNYLFRTDLEGNALDTLELGDIISFQFINEEKKLYTLTSSNVIKTDIFLKNEEVVVEGEEFSWGHIKEGILITEPKQDSLHLYSIKNEILTDTSSLPLFVNSPIVLENLDEYFVVGNSAFSQVGLYNSFKTKKPKIEDLPDVELLDFTIDSIKYENYYWNEPFGFTFQPSLKIKNNSNDTLRSFMIYRLSGFGVNCYLESYSKEIKNLEIIPGGDSLIQIFNDVPQYGLDDNLCFKISSPNSEIEYYTANNSLCKQFEVLSLSNINGLNEKSFNVSPNPFSKELNVTVSEERIEQISIYDMMGVLAYDNQNVAGNESINLTTLSKGIYLIKVKTEKGIFSKKIIKN